MKRFIFLSVFLSLSTLMTAQDKCQILFHMFNPSKTSTKTNSLVLNNLSLCGDNLRNIPIDLREFADKGFTSRDINTRNYISGKIYKIADQRNLDLAEVYLERKHNQIRDRFQTNNLSLLDDIQDFDLPKWISIPLNSVKPKLGRVEKYFDVPFFQDIATLGLIGYGVGKDFFFFNKERKIEFEKLLKERTIVFGAELEKCRNDEGGFDGDCFGKVLFSSLAPEAGISSSFKTDFANSVSNEQASSIMRDALNDKPDLFDHSRNEYDKITLQEKENSFIDKLDELSEARSRESLEILQEVEKIAEDLENLTQAFEEFQNEVRDQFTQMNDLLGSIINQNNNIEKELLLHRGLIQNNAINIQIIQEMLLANADQATLMNLFEKCQKGNSGCPTSLLLLRESNREDFDRKADLMAAALKLKKIAKTTEKIFKGLQVGIEIASALGLSGSSQEKLAKGLHYAQSTFQTAYGLAAAFTGADPFGGSLQAIKGIMGFMGFGGGSDSPELKLITQLREEMHGRFDRIEEKLDDMVSLQIQLSKDLTKNIQINREIMQFEFGNIKFELGEILANIDLLQSLTWLDLDNDINDCWTLLRVIGLDTTLTKLNLYQNYIDIYNLNPTRCESCIEGLQTRLSINSDFRNLLPFFNVRRENNPYLADRYLSYRKCLTFFSWLYGPSNQNHLYSAVQNLLIPSKNTNWDQKTYCETRNDPDLDFILDPEDVLSEINFIDAQFLRDFIQIYSIYFPFFEIQDFYQSDGFKPFSLEDFIKETNKEIPEGSIDFIKTRNLDLQTQIDQISNICKVSSAQQNLLSGHLLIEPFYRIIYQSQHAGKSINFNGEAFGVQQFVIDILNSNPVIANNFATYVIRRNYGFNTYNYSDTILERPEDNQGRIFTQNAYELPYQIVYESDTSIVIDSLSGTHINLGVIESASMYVPLDFEIIDIAGEINLFLVVNSSDCQPSENISCTAFIPVPSINYINGDIFTYTQDAEFADQCASIIEALGVDIYFPSGFSNNFLENTQVKLTLIDKN